MKRDEVRAKISGITEEQLDWLMTENGRDVTAEKAKASALQGQVRDLSQQLTTAQDGLKAFDGVDVNEMKGQISALQTKLAEQADGFAFDMALDGAIRDAKGRDVNAIRGMLDVDALRQSKNRSSDIQAAIETLAKEKSWAFGEEANGYPTVQDGGDPLHATAGSAAEQFAAWFDQVTGG